MKSFVQLLLKASSFSREFIQVERWRRLVESLNDKQNTVELLVWKKSLPRTNTTDEIWFLNQSECWKEAEADANENCVRKLSAGALHNRCVVVLDEDKSSDDGEDNS